MAIEKKVWVGWGGPGELKKGWGWNLGSVTVGGLALATHARPPPLSKASVNQLIFGRTPFAFGSRTKSALSASITTTTSWPT